MKNFAVSERSSSSIDYPLTPPIVDHRHSFDDIDLSTSLPVTTIEFSPRSLTSSSPDLSYTIEDSFNECQSKQRCSKEKKILSMSCPMLSLLMPIESTWKSKSLSPLNRKRRRNFQDEKKRFKFKSDLNDDQQIKQFIE